MPEPGKAWRHVTISTLNSWLPGDPRGWRSRRHRRHSSGDYRSPPPDGEHAGLHERARRISGEVGVIAPELRAVIGESIQTCLEREHRVLALTVAATHAHILVELPLEIDRVRTIIGEAKNVASRRVRREMPGRVWSAGGSYRLVETVAHQRRVFGYIRDHVHEGAWVWTYRDGVLTPG